MTKIVKMSQTSQMRQTRLTSQMYEKPIKQVNQIKLVNISQFWTIETFVQRGLSVKAHQGYLGKFSMGFEQGSPSLVWTNDLEKGEGACKRKMYMCQLLKLYNSFLQTLPRRIVSILHNWKEANMVNCRRSCAFFQYDSNSLESFDTLQLLNTSILQGPEITNDALPIPWIEI